MVKVLQLKLGAALIPEGGDVIFKAFGEEVM